MPFKSKAQRSFLYAKHPKVAKEFSEETSASAYLPEHVGAKKKKTKTPWNKLKSSSEKGDMK